MRLRMRNLFFMCPNGFIKMVTRYLSRVTQFQSMTAMVRSRVLSGLIVNDSNFMCKAGPVNYTVRINRLYSRSIGRSHEGLYGFYALKKKLLFLKLHREAVIW